MRPAVNAMSVGTLLALLAPVANATDRAESFAVPEQCTASTYIAERPPALSKLQAEHAWTITRGSGVVVAVIDSGVNADNPHLTAAVTGGADLVGDGASAAGRADLYGHGTAIAGVIAARKIDGSGIEGLAPEAQILSVRVYSSAGAGEGSSPAEAGRRPSIARLAEGIRYAADRGAQIIAVALSTARRDAELVSAADYARRRGSLVIASAGNRDDTDRDAAVRYPAGVPGVVGVAATPARGERTAGGPHVSLAAHGDDILTTSAEGADCRFATDAPASSFSTGYVAAAAALVAAAHPDETPAQWAYRLEATAVRASLDERDDITGWGTVQPFDAIVLVPGPGVRGPESPFDSAALKPAPGRSASALAIAPQSTGTHRAIETTALSALFAAIALAVIGSIGVVRRRRTPLLEAEDSTPPRDGLYRPSR